MDGEILASQLSQLGRQLDDATAKLGELDVLATSAGIEAARLKEEYENVFAAAFLSAEGAIETRKMIARCHCVSTQDKAQDAAAGWERAKSKVRNQQAMVRAINSRIDIGRSLLSREKSLAMVLS
jgi:hypothetical protein